MNVTQKIKAVVDQLNTVMVGKSAQVQDGVACLLAGGHLLIEDVPGVGKTTLAHALARTFGLQFSRVQFTADLMPSDLSGVSVYDRAQERFVFHPGPVFAHVLLADEINRASPKTQAALLEVMEEGHVTIDGVTHDVGKPFLVLATQNPVEQAGTYRLPEAQLDRFLLQIDVDYPDRDAERAIILATTGVEEATAEPVFDAESLMAAQRLVRRLPVGETVVERILDLVRAARPEGPEAHPAVANAVAWGPGPRAAQALMLAIRARALLQGRLAPGIEDVAALAHPVLIHRMALGFAARAEGQTLDRLIARLTEDVTGVSAGLGAAA